ncbi:hypothetical protein BU24DRAFT_443108 [Aaosphaeria arxii CBS 175.79]|uniref:25S rRNA (uridine-N(3))-methyltransferase BMT5-like domain-containing protein n=1 Tax=Aaosphaeria arxii CBS 175.79 TaxID=1450172 RepID=A0A6A5XI16_9PLEO|nr:uncharacterized protein BU24DRAFT_443108 [Aaosphaeria arxii CBS 175.79]KAF2012762.1 hypothetical protein BU24DRAFT_443108 [Aaosphaeria arxii CBS 175.79]
MSKTKTKQRRREAKREHHKKLAKQSSSSSRPQKPTPTQQSKKNPAPKTKETPSEAPTATANPTATPKPHHHHHHHHQPSQQNHPIPFDTYDRILLLGDGDFSFTHSLAIAHGCASVTGTSFDSADEVREKYPTFPPIASDLAALTPPVPLHHSVDATKVSSYKHLARAEDGEAWDVVGFMFPHVGGKSTDVNRQVRANQALLVGFFRSVLQLPPENASGAAKQTQHAEKGKGKGDADGKKKRKRGGETKEFLRMGGKVVVTLFEGEPYTLWNIRDLARHCGLKVVESWRFDWAQYPGYGHVRTLGAIEGGGGWKGEEREARMFVFEKVEIEDSEDEGRRKKRKGKGKKGGKGSGSESEGDD